MQKAILISATAAAMLMAAGEANAKYVEENSHQTFQAAIHELSKVDTISPSGYIAIVQLVEKAQQVKTDSPQNRETSAGKLNDIRLYARADRTW